MYEWQMAVDKVNDSNRGGGNKLRFYRIFKRFYEVENHCIEIMPRAHRAAFSKFRCGVAPLNIEVGRYTNQPIELRVCPFCTNITEDEAHVILKCPAYTNLRQDMYTYAINQIPEFLSLSDIDKINVLFSAKSLVKIVAKTCFNILKTRKTLLYK